MTSLSDKQQFFCREYLIDSNATQAAIRAGYSENTAGSQAHDLLKKPEIQVFVNKLKRERENRLEISADKVLQEIAKLAFYDARKLFDDDGRPIHISKLDDNTAAVISGVDIVTKGNQEVGLAEITKVKLSDKKGALELLARNLKLLVDRTEHSFADLTELIDAARQTK